MTKSRGIRLTPNGAPMAHYLANKNTVTAECKIWPYATNSNGYGHINFNGRMLQVHNIACADRWGPAPEPGMVAAHGPCHDRLCWNGAHLSWKTKAANSADMRRDGTLGCGEDAPLVVLTEPQVRAIRDAYARGSLQRELAEQYGVSQPNISSIVCRRSWQHVA